MIKLKSWFFRHYWWFFLVLLFLLILLIVIYEPLKRIEVIIGLSSILISSFFFIQKQRLEELRMFKELFEAFNKRYDKLNDDLNIIISTTESLKDEEKQTLYDYFNLCSEEYFYYKQGYIPSEVWESWLNGMKYFYKDPKIQQIWDEELKSGSYYGFKNDHFKNSKK